MDKLKLAQELKTTVDDINYLLLESGIDDNPENSETITSNDADRLRSVVSGTKKAIASTPSTEGKTQALARVPVSEIALKTGIAEDNINGMIDAIWQLELAAIAEEERKLEEYRNAARLASKSDILKRELTAKINRLNAVSGFNPYDILGTDPEQGKEDLNNLTADALALAESILGEGKLVA